MRLLGNRILVKPDAPDETTPNGLVIPENAREQKNIGTIVLASEKVDELKAGDRIIFSKHAGVPIDRDGSEHLLMFPTDVISTI